MSVRPVMCCKQGQSASPAGFSCFPGSGQVVGNTSITLPTTPRAGVNYFVISGCAVDQLSLLASRSHATPA